MKELDELITYIENHLIGEHKDIEIIDEAIKKYAELYHKKQLELYGVVGQSEQLKGFIDFCSDNYSLEIPDRIIEAYKQSL